MQRYKVVQMGLEAGGGSSAKLIAEKSGLVLDGTAVAAMPECTRPTNSVNPETS